MPTVRKYATNAERQAAYRDRRIQEEKASGLPRIPPSRGNRRWEAMLAMASSLLEGIGIEMGEYWEDRSESWQESERGEAFTERMESVEEITSLLRDLV